MNARGYRDRALVLELAQRLAHGPSATDAELGGELDRLESTARLQASLDDRRAEHDGGAAPRRSRREGWEKAGASSDGSTGVWLSVT